MQDLQTSVFEKQEVRMIEKESEPQFVGKDVAEILGYSNTRKAILNHVDDEDKGVTKWDTLGGLQDITIINESGLYSLILKPKLPNAKKFKRWVTSEVLPSIRKHGMYATAETVDRLISDPDTAIKLLEMEYGKPFTGYIYAVTKETPSNVAAIEVPEIDKRIELDFVKEHIKWLDDIKNGQERPSMWGRCEYCRKRKELDGFISTHELLDGQMVKKCRKGDQCGCWLHQIIQKNN